MTWGYAVNMGGGVEIDGGNSKSVLLESGSSRHGKAWNIESRSNSCGSNGDSISVSDGDSFKGEGRSFICSQELGKECISLGISQV